MSKQKIAVIIGSTRPGRVGPLVADWYLKSVKGVEGAELDIVDLEDFDLPLLDESMPASMNQYQHQHTKNWSEKINGYDAYIFITPEYNHSAPASLTNAISFLNKEWNRKPVAFVSYGTLGGVRAVEHLRGIAGELHMADIRAQVTIREPWNMIDEAKRIRPELVFGDPKEQLAELLWWSHALKQARDA